MQPSSWKTASLVAAIMFVRPAVTPARQVSNPSAPALPSRVVVQLVGPSQPVRVGIPFNVQAEITPRAGIHVYAPGNRDYIPVALALDWPRGIRVKDPIYPPGEPFIFGALKELVTTYQRPFKVTQEATILGGTPAARARSIEVAGAVKYQACDDRICFPVDSVAVRVSIPIHGPSRGGNK